MNELEAQSRSRPVRIAFLVQEDENADLILDAVIADSYRRWGGRFSLIIPCADQKVREAFWPWLEAFDPDIVYSYVALANEEVLKLHERAGPSEYQSHELRSRDKPQARDFQPDYLVTPLASLSTIFRSARYPGFREDPAPLRIIDTWFTERPSRFLTDNFGTYWTSFGTGMYPPDALPAARLLHIIAPDSPQDRQRAIPSDIETIDNEIEAVRRFAQRRATSLSIASILFAPRLEIRSPEWGESFNLVVGNTFADRVMFWNARSLMPSWLDDDICCLRIDADIANDDERLNALVELLNRRNHVNSGSGGGANATVRSMSHSVDELEAISAKLKEKKLWSFVRSKRLDSLDQMIPTAKALEEAREGHRLGSFHARPDWMSFRWAPPMVRPPGNIPDHLSDAPPRQAFARGAWATDFILQAEGPRPRMSDRNLWQLPRRWRMAGAFKASFNGISQNVAYQPRATRAGHLSIIEMVDRAISEIAVPSQEDAIHHALSRDGLFAERRKGPPVPPAKTAWMQPSNEARYLAGTLGMAGGIGRASHYLLHPFLRKLFASMGGSPRIADESIRPTVERLAKLSRRQPKFDLTDDADRTALGALIVRAANSSKTPRRYRRYEALREEWAKHRSEFWLRQGRKPQPDPDYDWEKDELESLENCLVEMRRDQVLFQGHEWICPNCHHRNWVDLEGLSAELTCGVCTTRTDAPIAIDWLFRTNDFLVESLRDHSVLSLIWLLALFRNRARRSLLYAGPSWFGFTRDSENPDAEADLLIVADGVCYLCEVKSSWTSVRPSDVDNLLSLAERLRPDVALLAVMETGEGLTDKIEQARASLDELGISFEVITDNARDDWDDPYLFVEARS
jgi:hypothetical protein